MAQPIHCDGSAEPHLADYLTTQLANGSTLALCEAHWQEFCLSVAAALVEAEAAATAVEAATKLGAIDPGEEFPTSGESSPADVAPAEPPTKGARRRGGVKVAPMPSPEANEAPRAEFDGLAQPGSGQGPE